MSLIFVFLAVFFLHDLEPETALTATSVEIQGPLQRKFTLDSAVGGVFSLIADPAITRPKNDIGVDGKEPPPQAADFIGRVLDNNLMIAKCRMLYKEVGELG